MSSHLNEYLVATNSVGRHRPDPSRAHRVPRAPWRIRLSLGRRAHLVDTTATATATATARSM